MREVTIQLDLKWGVYDEKRKQLLPEYGVETAASRYELNDNAEIIRENRVILEMNTQIEKLLKAGIVKEYDLESHRMLICQKLNTIREKILNRPDVDYTYQLSITVDGALTRRFIRNKNEGLDALQMINDLIPSKYALNQENNAAPRNRFTIF